MRDVVISRKPSIFAVLFHANFGLVEKSIKVFTLTLYYFVFPHWWSFIENWAWGFWTNKAMSRACTTVFQFFRVVNGWNMRIWLPYEHMAQTQRATKKILWAIRFFCALTDPNLFEPSLEKNFPSIFEPVPENWGQFIHKNWLKS